MHNIKLTIEYNGTNYCGWQVQRLRRGAKDERRRMDKRSSIQETIENCLEKILQEKVRLIASGRTDSGVHALGQVANFMTSNKMGPNKIRLALNGNLPFDIRIIKTEYVSLDFHSRYWAKSKTYRYLILNQNHKSPFFADYSYWLRFPLDIKLMKEAAPYLLGRHDFKAFCASGSSVKNTVREIKNISINFKQFLFCKFICVEIEADGFLYNMVRNIVGSLIEVGKRRFKPDYIKELFKKNDRKLAGMCVPANGLFLVKVKY